jgi:hypothetical protein
MRLPGRQTICRAEKLASLILSLLLCVQPVAGGGQGQNTGQTPGQNPVPVPNGQASAPADPLSNYLSQIQGEVAAIEVQADACAKMRCPACDCAAAAQLLQALINAETILDALHNALIDQESTTRALYYNAYSNSHLTGTKLAQLQDSLAWEEFFHNLGSYLLKVESILNFQNKLDKLDEANPLDALNSLADLGKNINELSSLIQNGLSNLPRGASFDNFRSGMYSTADAPNSNPLKSLSTPWDIKSEGVDVLKVADAARTAYNEAIQEGGNGSTAILKALKDSRNLRTLIARSLKMYSEWKLKSEKQLAAILSADQGPEAAAITQAYQEWQQARDQQQAAADTLAAIRRAIDEIKACMAKANCGSMSLSRPTLPTFAHYGDALRALQAMLPTVIAALKQSFTVTDKCPPPGTTPQTTPAGGTPSTTPTTPLPPPKHVVETNCPECAGIALELARTLDEIDFVQRELSRIRANLEQASELEAQAQLVQNNIQRISALIDEFRNGKADQNTLQKAGNALIRDLGLTPTITIDIESLQRDRLDQQNTLRTLQEKIQALRAEEGQLPALENQNLTLTEKAAALRAKLAECERNCPKPRTVKMTQCYNEKYAFDQADLRQSKYPSSTNKTARDSALKKLCDCLKAHPEVMTDELRKLCPEPSQSKPGPRSTTGSNSSNQTNNQTGMRTVQTPNQAVLPTDVQTKPSSGQVGGENPEPAAPPAANDSGGANAGANGNNGQNNNSPANNASDNNLAGNNPNGEPGATPPPAPANAGGAPAPATPSRPKDYKNPQAATDSTGITIPYSYTLTICRGDDYVFPIRGQEVDIRGISVNPVPGNPPNAAAVGFGNGIRIYGKSPGASTIDADVVPTDGSPLIHVHFLVKVIDCSPKTTVQPTTETSIGESGKPVPGTSKPANENQPGANGANGNNNGAANGGNNGGDNANNGAGATPPANAGNAPSPGSKRPKDYKHAQPAVDSNDITLPYQYTVTICQGDDYVFPIGGPEVDIKNLHPSGLFPGEAPTAAAGSFGNGIRISGRSVGLSSVDADVVPTDGSPAVHLKIWVNVIDCSHHATTPPNQEVPNPPMDGGENPIPPTDGGEILDPTIGNDNMGGLGAVLGGLAAFNALNSALFGNAPTAPAVQNIVVTININPGGAAPTAPTATSGALLRDSRQISVTNHRSTAQPRARLSLTAYHLGSPSRAPSLDRPAPELSSLSSLASLPSAEGLTFSIASNGNLGNNALEFRVHDPSGKLKGNIGLPEGTVLEPLKPGTPNPASAPAGGSNLSQQLTAYCLEMAKLPPEVGQLYRLASPAMQQKYQPVKNVLQAGSKLAAAGQFHPDSDPSAYADFIRQNALWAQLENWGEQKFTEVFLERTKKNAEHMNVKWTQAMDNTLRAAAPGRWRDIAMVLDEARKLGGTQGSR